MADIRSVLQGLRSRARSVLPKYGAVAASPGYAVGQAYRKMVPESIREEGAEFGGMLSNPLYSIGHSLGILSQDNPVIEGDGNTLVPHSVAKADGNDMATRPGTVSSAPVTTYPDYNEQMARPSSMPMELPSGTGRVSTRNGVSMLDVEGRMSEPAAEGTKPYIRASMPTSSYGRPGNMAGLRANAYKGQDWDKYYANTSGYQQDKDSELREKWRMAREADELNPLEHAARMADAQRRYDDPGNMKAKQQVIADMHASIQAEEANPKYIGNPDALRAAIIRIQEMAKIELESLDPKADYGRVGMPTDPFGF